MRRRLNPPPERLPAGVRVVVKGYVATALTPLTLEEGYYWGEWDHRSSNARSGVSGLPARVIDFGQLPRLLEQERREWRSSWPKALAEARAAFAGDS